MTSILPSLAVATVLCTVAAVTPSAEGASEGFNRAGNKPVPLKQAEFIAADRVPYEIEIPLLETGPADDKGRVFSLKPTDAWLPTQRPMVDLLSTVRLERKKKELHIYFEGRPRPLKVKGGKKPGVVEFNIAGIGPDGDGLPMPVLFYTKQEQWFAAPASVARAKTQHGVLEILDVDLDGSFGSGGDYYAWRNGRLRFWGDDPQVHADHGLHRIELSEHRTKYQVALTAIPNADGSAIPQLPEDLDPDIGYAWLRTNELRNHVGLEPVALDRKRLAAAQSHAEYLQLNGPSGSSSINVHDEDPNLPGYTPEGKLASGGNVKWGSGGYKLTTQPDYEFATLFHRSEYIYPSTTMGTGADGGYSVVWIENAQNDNARWLNHHKLPSRWVMVPGPGQVDVPRRAKRDNPIPKSVPDFYQAERGWPISVATSYKYGQLTDVSLRLFDAKGAEVDGYPINMGDAGFGAPGFQAHYLFAAKSPLESEAKYRAEFRARLKQGGREMRYDWTFQTGK